MSTITQNQAAHPEWFVDPATLSDEVKAVLAWKANQPYIGGGTIGAAWDAAGKGHYYVANVREAQTQVEQFHAQVAAAAASGEAAPVAFWLQADAPKAPEAHITGAVFGGTAN